MSDYRHDIEKYLRGELTPSERNALERKALHDPFLADALEGAEQINAEDFLQDVASLQSKMANRKPVWLWPSRIAAGLALIAVASFTVWIIMQPEPDQNLAFEKTSPAPALSFDSVAPSSGEPSSPPSEKPKISSTAGPAARRPDVATRTAPELKSNTKPVPIESGIADQPTKEPAGAVAAAPEQPAKDDPATEKVVAESLALSKATEDETERSKNSLRDDQTDKKLTQRSAGKKDVTAKEAPAARVQDFINADSISTKTNLITGRVTSTEDGSPLPGVNVVIKGTTIGTSTDVDGKYQLDAGDAKSIVYSFIGLESREVEIKDQRIIDVALPLDAQQLNEIVVVTAGGLTVQRRELGNQATEVQHSYEVVHPQDGMINFQQYLKKNIRYPQTALDNKTEGRVTVQFTIEPDGRLTDFTILKGIGSGCDEELIRLIKEGPPWVPTKRDGQRVRDKAKVRFKFELPK